MTFRKVLALAGISLTVAALAAVPTSAASAAPMKTSSVTFSVKFEVRDDDSSIWGPSFDHAYSGSNKAYAVNSIVPRVYDHLGMSSECAGDEVSGELHPTVIQTDVAGSVNVSSVLQLFEGSRCWSMDMDGWTKDPRVFHLAPGASQSYSQTVRNTSEGTLDMVKATVTVHNSVS